MMVSEVERSNFMASPFNPSVWARVSFYLDDHHLTEVIWITLVLHTLYNQILNLAAQKI